MERPPHTMSHKTIPSTCCLVAIMAPEIRFIPERIVFGTLEPGLVQTAQI